MELAEIITGLGCPAVKSYFVYELLKGAVGEQFINCCGDSCFFLVNIC